MERKEIHNQNPTTEGGAQHGASWHQRSQTVIRNTRGYKKCCAEAPLFPNHSSVTLHHKAQRQPKRPLVPAFSQGG